jgi:YD repeat-containing protein
MGRLTSVTVDANVSVSGNGSNKDTNLTTGYAYDDLGRQTDVTDPLGHVSHAGYDRMGRLTSGVTDYGSGQLNLTALAAYDSLGELLATCNPNPVAAQTCTASNIATSTAAWRYGYDEMGHQTSATPPTMAIATQLASISATYDSGGGGRLSYTTQGARITTPSYDAAGRVYASAVVVGSNNFTTTNTLDSLGRTTQVAVTGTTTDTLTQTYDSLGRLTDLKRGADTLTHFAYNADGTAASRTDRVGSTDLTSSLSYTDLGQLHSVSLPAG